MPRVRLAVPAEQRKIEADLTEHCTGGADFGSDEIGGTIPPAATPPPPFAQGRLNPSGRFAAISPVRGGKGEKRGGKGASGDIFERTKNDERHLFSVREL